MKILMDEYGMKRIACFGKRLISIGTWNGPSSQFLWIDEFCILYLYMYDVVRCSALQIQMESAEKIETN